MARVNRRDVTYECGAYTWTEQWAPSDHPDLEGDDGGTDRAACRILLNASMEDAHVQEAILHERIHACLTSNLPTGTYTEEQEEQICYAVSRGLLQINKTVKKLPKPRRRRS